MVNHNICLAPMLGYTDRHFRYLLRLISREIFLYSEMVVTKPFSQNKNIHTKLEQRFFPHNKIENPIAIQLAGNNPQEIAFCAKLAEKYNYDEINLNVGCPSLKVQAGDFGAVLMKDPGLVADCVSAARSATKIPVSIKTRLGVDEFDDLYGFINTTHAAGCNIFIIHARIAKLNLSVRKNRSALPLQYEKVYQIKKDFPNLTIILNGEIKSQAEIQNYLKHVDGIMVGRALYNDPLKFFPNAPSQKTLVKNYLNYMQKEIAKGTPINHITRHLLTIIKNHPKAKEIRNKIINAKNIEELINLCLLKNVT